MKRLYTIFLLLFALTGCSGFLEEYSQDQAYVEGYDDLDELLLGNAYFERNQVIVRSGLLTGFSVRPYNMFWAPNEWRLG